MVVATKLLARRKFIDTGKQFNMIAASWIQFMIHDWIDHLEDTKQVCCLVYIQHTTRLRTQFVNFIEKLTMLINMHIISFG